MLKQMAFAAIAICSCIGPLRAEEPISFAGKSITMIIPTSAGGGTDATGRFIASALAKYLPGKPAVIARNVPGANGITAMNYFVQQAPTDGFTISMGSSSQADPVHYRAPQAHFDPTLLTIIGGAGRGGTVLIISKDAEARLHDRNAAPVVMGSLVGVPRSGMLTTAWGIAFLGWNAKWVIGYRGTNDLVLALERGEIDMTSFGNIFQIKKLLATGRFKVLSQSGTLENGRFVPRDDFGDAPLFADQMTGKITDPLALKAFEYWSNLTAIDKWIALPSNSDARMVAAYRRAYQDASNDADFLEKGKKISEEFGAMSHSDVELILGALGSTPPEAIDYINTMLLRQGLEQQKG